jgi:hypothetical protein
LLQRNSAFIAAHLPIAIAPLALASTTIKAMTSADGMSLAAADKLSVPEIVEHRKPDLAATGRLSHGRLIRSQFIGVILAIGA